MTSSVYILKSIKNGSFYIGSANDPIKRLAEHNAGRSPYTKNNKPFEIVFSQEFGTIGKARKIELKLKSWKRKDFLEKIIEDGFIKCLK